jgi:polysaccharide chain length determinant protein (PEP-CTERM system associated)
MNVRWDPIRDKFEGVWRFRWLGIAAATAIALLGWLIVFALPDRYEADAEVLVNQQTQLKPALQGLATDQNVGVQLDYVRESLLNGPELRKLAQQVGALAPSTIDSGREEQALKGIRNRIQLTIQAADDEPQAGGIPAGMTYGITYRDVNRDHALRLVSALMDRLVNETLGNNRRGSENAQQFLGAQIEQYQARLKTAEDRLAAFKSQHLGLMPTEQGGYFAQLQHETEAIDDARAKLATAESRHSTLARQLRGDTAISAAGLPAIGADGKPVGVDTVSRIAATQARLDALLLKYTDKHPDVIAARQELADLKRQRQVEIASLRRGDVGAAVMSGASSNPVYQSILLQLNQASVDISDLEAQLAEHEEKAKELRGLVDTAPQIEAQYAQLSRDYDVTKAQYTALLSSFEKERLGEQAGSAGAVRFEMVQPPMVSYQPVSPRRGRLLAGILCVALVGGGFFASWLDQLRPVVGSASSLAQLTGVAILGVVSSAFPTRQRAVLRSQRRQLAMAVVSLVVGFAIALLLSRTGVRLNIPGLTEVPL